MSTKNDYMCAVDLDNPVCEWGDIIRSAGVKRWDWDFFSIEEMTCRCGCGACKMNPGFMDMLERLRELCDFPLPVTSGFRCTQWDMAQSKGGGPHTRGIAADIRCHHSKAYTVSKHAFAMGFKGIFWMQHGPHEDRFIHLDIDKNTAKHPRPHVMSYPK